MKLYNYDYSDMMELTFGYRDEPTQLISKVYPTKLEVKIDEEKNIPYLYYEGIVQTNKGTMKITFPRLDLVLECVQNTMTTNEEIGYCGLRLKPQIIQYKMTTEFSNINEDTVMFELQYLDSEDSEDIREHFKMEG